MDTKICIKCGLEKPLGEFYSDKRLKCGKASSCKSCVIKYQNKRKKLIAFRTLKRDIKRVAGKE